MPARCLTLLLLILTGTIGSGCSLITIQQEPFDPLKIEAKRPPPPPKKTRVVLTASNIQITEKVLFEYAKADVRPESHGLLDEIAEILSANPQIEQVEIGGHTDAKGDAAFNRRLSEQRAAAVRTYLVKKGIAAARLVAKGFGPDKPIADNESDEGREKNRRVELVIQKQGPKKTEVQE